MDIKVIRTIDYRYPANDHHQEKTRDFIAYNVKSFSFPNEQSIHFSCERSETTLSLERVIMLLQNTESVTLDKKTYIVTAEINFETDDRYELYQSGSKPKEQWGEGGWGALIKLSSRADPKTYLGDQVNAYWNKHGKKNAVFIKVDAKYNVVSGNDGAVRVYANDDDEFSGDSKKPILTIPPNFTEYVHKTFSSDTVTGTMDIQSNGGVSGTIDFV